MVTPYVLSTDPKVRTTFHVFHNRASEEWRVTDNNNSPIQDYIHPDDQTQPTFVLICCVFNCDDVLYICFYYSSHIVIFEKVFKADFASAKCFFFLLFTDVCLSCTICRCDYEEDETVFELPCSHLFHPQCVTTWLKMVISILLFKTSSESVKQ